MSLFLLDTIIIVSAADLGLLSIQIPSNLKFILIGLVVFLLAGAYWLRPLPDGYGLAEIPEDYVDSWTVMELRQKESSLKKISKSKRPIGWSCKNGEFIPSIPIEWQNAAAIAATDLALEVFLINEVWNSKGKQYRAFRLKESPYKDEIEQFKFNFFTKKELNYGGH